MLKVELTYPEEVVDRIDKRALGALSPVAAGVVMAWLRHVHQLPERRDSVGLEDWPHPTGSGYCRSCGLVANQGESRCECGGRVRRRRPWHPHHNIIVRGEQLYFDDGGSVVRRRLAPHVSRAQLELLRAMWAEAIELVFGVRPLSVSVHYNYAKSEDRGRVHHRLKYVARTWPGWHEAALGKVQRRAYGLFRRGWPLMREVLGLGQRAGCCEACGGRIDFELIDAWDLPRRQEVMCLVHARGPPR